MKTTARRVGHFSLKLVIGLIVLICLAAGLAGLVLPIVPGVVFLALAAFVAARHFPEAEQWARRSPTLGRYIDGARRFSFERISLSRLTLGQRLRFGALLCAKAVIDGAALVVDAVTSLVRRFAESGAPGYRRRY